ncbi:Serpin-ZX [Forsythia ovata]|uniref:Serpin-ZX n=1 Tax=Forsythia ovata TaxID=205694 RepID=A0ABD1P8Z5_9LAMI
MDISESFRNQTDVSLLLAKNLVSSKDKDANLVFSPVSINVLLGLIAAGSKSLSLKPTFKEIVHNAYKAAASHIDFQTKAAEVTREVNLGAEKETSGLIKEQLLPSGSVDCSTRLIFANAVYFKGVWNDKFDASKTKDDNFFLPNGSLVQVPLMTSKKKQYIREFSGFKVLGLPYKQGEDDRKFSMYFFLPDAKDGLPALVEKFGSESGFLENHLPYRRVKVGAFRIPKFKISFGFEASEVLKGLGLVLPFSGDGLTEMVDSSVGQNLYVSSIFHKSFIERRYDWGAAIYWANS